MPGRLRTLLVIVGVLASAGVAAEEHPGRTAYLRYCSACHGTEARGDGTVAPTLNPKPADLTRLAANNGGTFPFTRVQEIIDGRNPIVAHGRPAMPVWGEVFGHEAAASTVAAPAQTRGKVQLIASYLASIQAH
jgi:mono/diheme cytochrome c family protein